MLIYSHCFLHYYKVSTVRHIHKCATYTLVRAYTDTDFFFFYICHSIPLFVTPLLFGTLEECETICATKCPNKIKPECHMLNKKNFSLQLDYKVYKTKTKLDSISICIEKRISALSVLQLDTLSRYD